MDAVAIKALLGTRLVQVQIDDLDKVIVDLGCMRMNINKWHFHACKIRKNYYLCRMEQNLLQTNIAYLKGVGPKKAEVLKKELGVFTFQDMLNQFPFRYIDRNQSRATVPEK